MEGAYGNDKIEKSTGKTALVGKLCYKGRKKYGKQTGKSCFVLQGQEREPMELKISNHKPN